MPAILPAAWTGLFDYARRPGRLSDHRRCSSVGAVRLVPMTPAAPAPASTGQLGRDGVPFGLDGEHHRAHRGFVAPVFRV
jgi:hypothetical protein